MLAVVVTLQVQLSVSVFTVTHCYLINSLSHCVDSAFSGRNQSIGFALAWVAMARDSESEHPFYNISCRAIPQYLCRSPIFALPISGDIL